LVELAARLGELFDSDMVEIEIEGESPDQPLLVRSARGRVLADDDEPPAHSGRWEEVRLSIERSSVGAVRLALPPARSFSTADRSRLQAAADRAAPSIRRALLHEQEHRIAIELQRGLVPKQLPQLDGVEMAAYCQPGSAVAEVGGDWYDAFALPGGCLGVVLGDVAGRGIPAASTMGQLRSLTRAFALTDSGRELPGEVPTRPSRYQLQHGEGELFTVMYAIVDPHQRSVTWASAGHLPPLLRTTVGDISYTEVGDGLMGIEDLSYRNFRA